MKDSLGAIKKMDPQLPEKLKNLDLHSKSLTLEKNLRMYSSRYQDVFVSSCLERDPILISTTKEVSNKVKELNQGEFGQSIRISRKIHSSIDSLLRVLETN
jgi:hypothetical protein